MKSVPLCLLALTLALHASAPPKPDETPTVHLAPQRVDKDRALKYKLQFEEGDQVRGNAAPLWIRAGLAARRVNYKWTNEEWEQMLLPLDKLPVKHFRRRARQARRRSTGRRRPPSAPTATGSGRR